MRRTSALLPLFVIALTRCGGPAFSSDAGANGGSAAVTAGAGGTDGAGAPDVGGAADDAGGSAGASDDGGTAGSDDASGGAGDDAAGAPGDDAGGSGGASDDASGGSGGASDDAGGSGGASDDAGGAGGDTNGGSGGIVSSGGGAMGGNASGGAPSSGPLCDDYETAPNAAPTEITIAKETDAGEHYFLPTTATRCMRQTTHIQSIALLPNDDGDCIGRLMTISANPDATGDQPIAALDLDEQCAVQVCHVDDAQCTPVPNSNFGTIAGLSQTVVSEIRFDDDGTITARFSTTDQTLDFRTTVKVPQVIAGKESFVVGVGRTAGPRTPHPVKYTYSTWEGATH